MSLPFILLIIVTQSSSGIDSASPLFVMCLQTSPVGLYWTWVLCSLNDVTPNNRLFLLFLLSCFSHVRLFATLGTVACQAPLSMGLSRQKYWLSCSPPGDLPHPGIKPASLESLELSGSLPLVPPRKSDSKLSVSSVAQSCLALCDPMNCSTLGLPVHHQLPESTQTHVLWVSDAIWSSHPLLSPSPPAFNLSQHQGLFKWVSSSHQVAKILEFPLQHQSFLWTPRTDFL